MTSLLTSRGLDRLDRLRALYAVDDCVKRWSQEKKMHQNMSLFRHSI